VPHLARIPGKVLTRDFTDVTSTCFDGRLHHDVFVARGHNSISLSQGTEQVSTEQKSLEG